MPIPKNASKKEVFDELRHGKTYARTKRKYGKDKARKQMIAIALKHERDKKKRKKGSARRKRRS